MKYTLTLTAALMLVWWLWSGHTELFILGLGLISCFFSVWLSLRMRIVDEEGAPLQVGIRPFTRYAPWLVKEIIKSNIEVTRIILSPKMKLGRKLLTVTSTPRTELGKVILANSITLTPGTVSIRVDGDQILVHALAFEGTAEELSKEMADRIRKLEVGE